MIASSAWVESGFPDERIRSTIAGQPFDGVASCLAVSRNGKRREIWKKRKKEKNVLSCCATSCSWPEVLHMAKMHIPWHRGALTKTKFSFLPNNPTADCSHPVESNPPATLVPIRNPESYALPGKWAKKKWKKKKKWRRRWQISPQKVIRDPNHLSDTWNLYRDQRNTSRYFLTVLPPNVPHNVQLKLTAFANTLEKIFFYRCFSSFFSEKKLACKTGIRSPLPM